MILLAMADKIKQHFNDNSVDICAIVNARSGKCPENCKFCAQSAHHNTGVQEYPFMDDDSLLEAAKKAKDAFGEVNVACCNAGVCRLAPFEEMSDEMRDFHIDVNIKGVWN